MGKKESILIVLLITFWAVKLIVDEIGIAHAKSWHIHVVGRKIWSYYVPGGEGLMQLKSRRSLRNIFYIVCIIFNEVIDLSINCYFRLDFYFDSVDFFTWSLLCFNYLNLLFLLMFTALSFDVFLSTLRV